MTASLFGTERFVLVSFVGIRNDLRWRDALSAHRPHKTIYNRSVPSSQMSVFNRIFAEPTARLDWLMIAASRSTTHRTAAGPSEKSSVPMYRPAHSQPELQATCRLRRARHTRRHAGDRKADERQLAICPADSILPIARTRQSRGVLDPL